MHRMAVSSLQRFDEYDSMCYNIDGQEINPGEHERMCHIMTMFMDTYEPHSIWELLTQSIPVVKMPLNHTDYSFGDYLWYAADGHRIQVERKQIDEILSDLNGVEEQLHREMSNGIEETILLVERTCEPITGNSRVTRSYNKPPVGLLQILRKILRHDGVLVPSHTYNQSYSGLQAWFYQLDKCGVTVIPTFDTRSTAPTLLALYHSSQKLEHTTLQRYIKPKIQTTSRNHHIMNLMSLVETKPNGRVGGAGIGEEIATALIERFGTVWWTLSQSVETLAETEVGGKQLGQVRARKILKAIGRRNI